MQQDNTQYPHIGQFHWTHFQKENGKRNVAVSSTVPRVDMMLDNGMVKEFADKKKEMNYSVVFDREYVFDYFYQKIVVNMGWNDKKLDVNVLRCFLDDFILHCETLHRNDDTNNAKAQAIILAQQFPHKTVEQWERELLGDIKKQWIGDTSHETEDERAVERTQGNEKVYLANDTARIENEEEKMITMDDYDPDIEEDCGEDDNIHTRSIRDLKRIASKAQIKGYGSMSKNDLIAAIITRNH